MIARRRFISGPVPVVLVTLLFLLSLLSVPAGADTSRTKILGYNVLITGTLTLARASMEGRLTSWRDALETFGWGGLAGGGFYQSKRMIAEGRFESASILSNLSYSMVENASLGRNPFVRLGYSVGPLRVHYNTPFYGYRHTRFDLDYSLAQTVAFGIALSISDGNDISFENGQFVLRSETVISRNEEGVVLGANAGYFNVLSPGYQQPSSDVYRHEFIHGVQSMQVASTSWEPYYRQDDAEPWRRGPQRVSWAGFSGWRLESNNLGVLLTQPAEYHRDPQEIEAWNLAQGQDPPVLSE